MKKLLIYLFTIFPTRHSEIASLLLTYFLWTDMCKIVITLCTPCNSYSCQTFANKYVQTCDYVTQCNSYLSQYHSEVEWDFWFVNFLCWNPVQKYDFLDTRHQGSQKIEKGQRNFWRSHQRPDREKSWIFIIFSLNYNQLAFRICGDTFSLTFKAKKPKIPTGLEFVNCKIECKIFFWCTLPWRRQIHRHLVGIFLTKQQFLQQGWWLLNLFHNERWQSTW